MILAAWLVLAIGLAHAAPARPLYQAEAPPQPPVARRVIDLAGTAWLGKYNMVQRIFILEPDGTLSYKSPAGKAKAFKNRGFWKFDGTNLYFEHFLNPNQKIMEFRAKITDDKAITGEATYLQTGAKATQTMQRTTIPDIK
jgi:hypothetical protein